ncbi:MAG: acetolactate decarboxylase [Caldiserica bacterium]|nr:acetolactate decarboxylase [Caldisericota bacterium]
MRKYSRSLVFLLLSFFFSTFLCLGDSSSFSFHETLTQVSTLNALLNGAYDGTVTYREIEKRGDFGVGTFQALNGEMVALDGKFYQVRADGKVYSVSPEEKTPFVSVTFFDPDLKFEIAGVDYEEFKKEFDKKIVNPNLFYAIKIDGVFEYIKTRSVPKQSKPYPPLIEVVKHQPTFEFKNIRGTMVGFWCPAFIKGISVPGYHLHFISQDRKSGGHVLKFTLKKGIVSLDITPNFFLTLPENPMSLQEINRENEIKEVER